MEICSALRRAVILPALSSVLRLLPWIIAMTGPALAQPAHLAPDPRQPEQAQLARTLQQGGLVLMLRHAETSPGVGDPPGFRADDCPTQRNLSDAGRAQARRLGQWFRQHDIAPTRVLSSPWCRTRETASLAFGGSEDWIALSNLIADRSRQAEHAREVLAAIARIGPRDLVVLVSHGVTIDAFIGEYLRQGEMVILRPAAGAADAGRRPAGAARDDGAEPQASRALEVVGRLMVP